MKGFLNSLNGWQRLFVLLAIVWLPIFIATDSPLPVGFDAMPNPIRSAIATKEVDRILPKPSFDLSTARPVTPQEAVETWNSAPFVYRMDDGTEVTSYSQESAVRDAYNTVVIQLRSDYQKLVVTAVIGKTLGYLIPLVVLYCLGALVGWVCKGFARGPK